MKESTLLNKGSKDGYLSTMSLVIRSINISDVIAKISVTSPIVINMPTRELLAGETKNSFV